MERADGMLQAMFMIPDNTRQEKERACAKGRVQGNANKGI